METQELMTSQTTKQKIQLVKGEFTPSEASHVIMALIDEKINFHKIQRLQQWEGNHKCNSDELDNRISQLEKEKQIAKEFINNSRKLNSNLKINGVLEITLADNNK
ncbi:MAG: hypothetical protein NWQ07_04345 [Flaviramulus sp.]|nr:hypothetical protein [Flaviramulus sp.]